MLDKQIALSAVEPRTSYVDYGFGSDELAFAGCHRFQIKRTLPTGASESARIELSIQCFQCNPKADKPSADKQFIMQYAEAFHRMYAKALFANAIHSIISRT